MTDKTDEQIARDKEMVAKMHGAKAAMETALRRISELETALRTCRDNLARVKHYVSENVYTYMGSNSRQESVHDMIDRQVAAASKVLG